MNTQSLPINYKIFLSSTFSDLTDLRENIIQRLNEAELFFYAMEVQSGTPVPLKETLKQEINDSDIFVLLVQESLGSQWTSGEYLTQFEFEYALKKNKPILAYFSDKGEYLLFDKNPVEPFKKKVSNYVKYKKLKNNIFENSCQILGDILNLINSNTILSNWIKSDITNREFETAISQKNDLELYITKSEALILAHCKPRLKNKKEKNKYLGPLVDSGLLEYTNNNMYSFVKGITPNNEIIDRRTLKYEFALDRFLTYKNIQVNGAKIVYDSLTNLSWYVCGEKNMTWNEANRWQENVNSETKNKLLKLCEGNLTWRLPDIKNLMSLLTKKPSKDKAYIDQYFFPQALHWFWSSTVTKDKKKAFYIETLHSQILSDPINIGKNEHYKGVILCMKGKIGGNPDLLEKPLQKTEITSNTVNKEKIKRIYGVYISHTLNVFSKEIDLQNLKKKMVSNRYYLKTFDHAGARPGKLDIVIKNEMLECDYFILILNSNILDENNDHLLSKVLHEIQIAKSLNLPISIISYLSEKRLRNFCQKLKFLPSVHGVPHFIYNINTDLFGEINIILQKQIDHNPRSGWIRKSSYLNMNKIIKDFNEQSKKIEIGESSLEKLLLKTNRLELRKTFESHMVLTPKLYYGERVYFISQETPITRFSMTKPFFSKETPILFTKVVNRFDYKKQEVYYDNYLKIKWYTKVLKKTNFEQANNYAKEVTAQKGETWRLPNIDELKTLITRQRGARKYMDEKIFHTGRWFWSGTIDQKNVYYIDYNYPKIGIEHPPTGENLNPTQKKSTILVSDIN